MCCLCSIIGLDDGVNRCIEFRCGLEEHEFDDEEVFEGLSALFGH